MDALGSDGVMQGFLRILGDSINYGSPGELVNLVWIIRHELDKAASTSWPLFSFRVCKRWLRACGEPFAGRVPDDSGPTLDARALSEIVTKGLPPDLELKAFSAAAWRQIYEYYAAQPKVKDEVIPVADLDLAAEREELSPSPGGAAGTAETPAAPEAFATLQEQIDAAWQGLTRSGKAPGTAAFGAWEVPVPPWIDASKDIFFNPQAITGYFNGLELFHNPAKNTVRPILPLPDRRERARSPRPARLICKFLKANAELWKWVGDIKYEQKMISLEQWVDPELQLEREERDMADSVTLCYEEWADDLGFGLERDYL